MSAMIYTGKTKPSYEVQWWDGKRWWTTWVPTPPKKAKP